MLFKIKPQNSDGTNCLSMCIIGRQESSFWFCYAELFQINFLDKNKKNFDQTFWCSQLESAALSQTAEALEALESLGIPILLCLSQQNRKKEILMLDQFKTPHHASSSSWTVAKNTGSLELVNFIYTRHFPVLLSCDDFAIIWTVTCEHDVEVSRYISSTGRIKTIPPG